MGDTYSIDELLESAEEFQKIRNKDKYARYRSWEHCNNVFNEKHDKLIELRKKGSDLSDEEYDYLALHLSFYLASWGMYRGSSLLLSTDYKIHVIIVKELMKEEYDNLWNITYENLNNEKENIKSLIDKIKKELYGNRPDDVKTFYKKEKRPNITNTLATKILLGTLACIPAYDKNFKDAIGKYEIASKTPNVKSMGALAKFYEDNEETLNNKLKKFEKEDKTTYPQMKLLDMIFFQYGMDNL